MEIEVITSVEGLETIAEAWESLLAEVPWSDIFMGPDWYSVWWRNFAAGRESISTCLTLGDRWFGISGKEARPNVMVFREERKIRAIAPLILFKGVWKRFPFRILTLPLNYQSPRSGILFTCEPDLLAQEMAGCLVRSKDWDVLLMDGIPVESKFLPSFHRQVARMCLLTGEHYDPWFHSRLAMEGSWEEFLAGKSHETRRNMNRMVRYLSELGAITVERYGNREGIEEGFRAFLEIDSESWKKEKGEVVAENPMLENYYVDLMNTFSKSNRSEIWILRIGGEPASGYLCLKTNGTLYTLKTSYKSRYISSRYSPGNFLLMDIMKNSWGSSFAVIDFCGSTPFVNRWRNEKRGYDHLVLYRKGLYPTAVHYMDFLRRLVRKRRSPSPVSRETDSLPAG
jgi:Acetyltransferase (GNAT) domain